MNYSATYTAQDSYFHISTLLLPPESNSSTIEIIVKIPEIPPYKRT
jgi:hypothetical protein